MSSITVREFLRSTSFSEDSDDSQDPLEFVSSRFANLNKDPIITSPKAKEFRRKKNSQCFLRSQETILEHEYKYRTDNFAYPRVRPHYIHLTHMIIMVGLPARGKTYIARKLCRYLNWCGISAKVVSAGHYRRENAGTDLTHEFFEKGNVIGAKIRQKSYEDALNDGASWLKESDKHQVLIYDATNATKERRRKVLEFCEANEIMPFFIESICYDMGIIETFLDELKFYSPDYIEMDRESARKDFEARLKHYEKEYEEISDKCEIERCSSYIKIIDAGKQYLVNGIEGYLQSHIVYYLMNIHTQKRSLYITMHGECEHNVDQKVGGSSGLTEQGVKFAEALKRYTEKEPLKDLKTWTSPAKGCIETSKFLPGTSEIWRNLNYLDNGECHGMKFGDLQQKFPSVFTSCAGPLDIGWRYPGGESYEDIHTLGACHHGA
ncbi:6-phosphofructo-2-kinase/fructose-2,6-bisphosphatase 2-like [Clytia hemisphaerica]|uniref:6-phosphofructo-2-kinase domain-containing protein n=1 Tax=Clytia hemisphaerica TaxID=252671 RepID=A0A7M5UYR9_9CNID